MRSHKKRDESWHQSELQWVEDTINLAFSMIVQTVAGAIAVAVDMYEEATSDE